MAKNILITGGNGGIGSAAARMLASGNHIFLHYYGTEVSAEMVARDIKKAGGIVTLLPKDLSSEKGCEELITELRRSTESLDVLINNAGWPLEKRRLEQIDWSFLEQVFALNVYPVVTLSRLCAPLLTNRQGSCVVNISSVAIRLGSEGVLAYTAAKGAIDSFTRALANELSPDVRANAVCPGMIETKLHVKLGNLEQAEKLKLKTPLECNGTADEVAHAIKFLIENKFITGETIDVNGGIYMR